VVAIGVVTVISMIITKKYKTRRSRLALCLRFALIVIFQTLIFIKLLELKNTSTSDSIDAAIASNCTKDPILHATFQKIQSFYLGIGQKASLILLMSIALLGVDVLLLGINFFFRYKKRGLKEGLLGL
jgi:NADH:ubiquinone oxidoreductase subunit 6 (subunit J)